MIGRADIEGSKSDIAMNAWPFGRHKPAVPCVNFSETSLSRSALILRTKIKCAFALLLHGRFSVLPEFTLVNRLTGGPTQSNSPPVTAPGRAGG